MIQYCYFVGHLINNLCQYKGESPKTYQEHKKQTRTFHLKIKWKNCSATICSVLYLHESRIIYLTNWHNGVGSVQI